MSIRYGIDLVWEPSFTAVAYQIRQILCGQYSSWAAEMQMLRMPLTPYFPCPDARLPILEQQVESIAMETAQEGKIARETGEERPYMALGRRRIVADPAINGVVMEFAANPALVALQKKALEAAQSHTTGLLSPEPFLPRIALLEYGAFPEAILPDAVEFANGVAMWWGLEYLPVPWRLLLTRYVSEAAGEDWSNGRWAADLSWRQLASHPLHAR